MQRVILGGLISTPIAVKVVKKFKVDKLKIVIGIVSITLGVIFLVRVFV